MSTPADIDLATITAIDVHTHVHASTRAASRENERLAAMGRYFGTGQPPAGTLPELAAYYRERRMAAVTFMVDNWSVTGNDPEPSNEELLEEAADHADVLIPFASIDPARGAAGVRQAERLITTYGVRGFKFHPTAQAFFPNDRVAYPLYEVLEGHGAIAMFHTGQTGAGAGARGGDGLRLKYSNPMTLDDVAADFPDLKIILAHPSFPWQEEALSVATHKPLVHIDLSGWSPKYFPPILVQYANTLLKHKVLFGSDFPLLTPERWMADLEKTGIRDEVKPGIFKNNAARLLGLTGEDDGR